MFRLTRAIFLAFSELVRVGQKDDLLRSFDQMIIYLVTVMAHAIPEQVRQAEHSLLLGFGTF